MSALSNESFRGLSQAEDADCRADAELVSATLGRILQSVGAAEPHPLTSDQLA